MDAVVVAEQVTKRWGDVVALRDVTVRIPGGVTGLLGANGAGKTTLLGLVLGFHGPDEGRLQVLGRDPATAGPEVRAMVGYAPEHDALPEDVRAQDLVRHLAELHGIPRRRAALRAAEALDLVGLGEERLRAIGTMSTGQKQRVKLAQALAHDPDLVLLDEPTNGLDPMQRDGMLQLVRRIGHELGIHVLVCSHLISEVELICDHVIVLDGGRLSASGEVSGLRAVTGEHLLEVDGDRDTLVTALRRAGLEAAVLGARQLVLSITDLGDLDIVRDTVASLDLGLRRLQPRTASLEELFFAEETG
ncbi:MAG TPA: ABC transporter ATP-binding protein [Nitriliruptorales bacterium]